MSGCPLLGLILGAVSAVKTSVYHRVSDFGRLATTFMTFLLSSPALWVMWGLLCGHLVAFKAPKSWPNKFLINVWGGFSVIFIASYTANIAALIAGLFFHNAVNTFDTSVSCKTNYAKGVNLKAKFIAHDPTRRHPPLIRCRVLRSEER